MSESESRRSKENLQSANVNFRPKPAATPFNPLQTLAPSRHNGWMSAAMETYERWEPLPDLPEQQLGTVSVAADGCELIATARFDDTAQRPQLRIDFGLVEAFKVYEEFSDCWGGEPRPMMPHAILQQVAWPFQEVRNSEWIRRVLTRNGGLEHRHWRHFVIVTVNVTLHVMTDSDVKAEIT